MTQPSELPKLSTYFARHSWKLDVDAATRQRLWDERRIGIHFPESPGNLPGEKPYLGSADLESLDPLDHPSGGARNAATRLVTLASQGGYACGVYAGHEECLIGYVTPGTSIELLRGTWSDATHPGREAVMKTLRLTRVGRVGGPGRSILLAGQPQQGTLMRWPSIGGRIRDLIENDASPIEAGTLSPAQQEVLCSEFLRWPEAEALGLARMEQLLLPIGRTLQDLDIIGMDADGRFVVAQVTHHTLDAAQQKLKRLMTFENDATACRVLFCRVDDLSHVNGVSIVPLKFVLDAMRRRPTGPAWFDLACGTLQSAVSWDAANGTGNRLRDVVS